MRTKQKLVKNIILLSFLGIVGFSLVLTKDIKADSKYSAGYFSGQSAASGADGGFVLRNCVNKGQPALQAVADATDKKKAFINLIESYYNGCGLDEYSATGTSHGSKAFNETRNKVGARYIILNMTGSAKPTFTGTYNQSTIANKDMSTTLAKWKNLMKQDSVKVEFGSYWHEWNSGYIQMVKKESGIYDISKFASARTDDGVRITQELPNKESVLVALFKSDCANPVLGKFTDPTVKLEEELKKEEEQKTWSIVPKSYVKSSSSGAKQSNITVTAGATVYWEQIAKNNGSTATNKSITAKSLDKNNTVLKTTTFSSGWASGTDKTVHIATQATTSADIGKKFCRKTSVAPQSSTNSGTKTSSEACVTVEAPEPNWKLAPSTTRQMETIKLGEIAKWTHKVKNIESDKVSKDITAKVWRQNYSSEVLVKGLPVIIDKSSAFGLKNLASGGEKSVASSVQINDSGVYKVCEWVAVSPWISPTSSSNLLPNSSIMACIRVESGWEIEPTTTVNQIKAFIGDEVIWKHMATNKGPNKTTKPVKYWYEASNKKTLSEGTPVNSSDSFTSKFSPDGRVPLDVNPGQYCRSTIAQPKSSSDSGATLPAEACVTVPYNYKLLPKISLMGDEITPGATVVVQPKVDNTSPNDKPATKSENINWELKVKVNSGAETIIGSGQKVFVVSTGQTVANVDYNLPNTVQFGDSICFWLSLSKSSHNGKTGENGPSTKSPEVCIKVGKRPKVQVLGGDIWAEGEINTNMNKLATGKFAGSWVEYGAIAKDNISGLATGGALNNQANACGYSLLSFTNKKCDETPPVLGKYNFTPSSLNISNFFNFSYSITTSEVDLSSLLAGEYSVTQNINLTAYSPIDKQIVLNAPGKKVTISSNIKYKSGKYQKDGLPQVIIIANDIGIKEDVTQVDAWLIAEETINTCSSIAEADITGDKLSGNRCPSKLEINGPVKAKKIKLYRTGGSDGPSDLSQNDPAETINFRPDAYLWAFNRMNQGFSIKSTYIIDQPVRF